MTALENALSYIRRGWMPVPIPHRTKGPLVKGWPDLRIGESDAPHYFNGQPQNVGVLLGTPSAGLVDIDLDHPRAVELADEYLPPTDAVFGRKGKPRSHRLYVVTEGDTATRKWPAPEKSMVVELRGDGCQTVFPGSTHPCGEAVTWAAYGAPATKTRAELESAVDALARAVIAELPPVEQADAPRPAMPATPPTDALDRCRKYIAKMPDAVAGHCGDNATFHAACECFRFGLTDTQAADLMGEFNATRCHPPWDDARILRNIERARARVLADGEFGVRLSDRPTKATTQTPGTCATLATPAPPLRWQPFPVELLPDALRCFVVETAAALGCDPAMVALPALAVVASAIGTTRAIQLKSSWREPAVLWGCIVVRSGAMKSPAFDAGVKPLHDEQSEAMNRYTEDVAQYDGEVIAYESELKAWKTSGRKRGEPQPEAPEKPACVRYVLGDATIESVAPILLENRRGVLVARDELAAWVRGMNQYKARGGADVAAWLELWRAGTLVNDRKTGEPRMIYIRGAAASVVGTIQPSTLASVLSPEFFESGFAARLLIVAPPTRLKTWSKRVPSARAAGDYERTIADLLDLAHIDGKHGPEPVPLPLTPEAEATWGKWYNRNARRIADAGTDREAAAMAKIEAYGARFALIFTLADDPGARAVDADAIRRGTALADWFGREAIRVYQLFAESDDDREARQLSEWIEGRGGSVTVRDVTHGLWRFRNCPDDARAALGELVASGVGRWVWKSSPNGGRPAERFELITAITTTETPTEDTANGGYGDGDAGDGCANANEVNPVGECVGDDDAEAMPDDGDEWGAI